jgi:hypothetical protein
MRTYFSVVFHCAPNLFDPVFSIGDLTYNFDSVSFIT